MRRGVILLWFFALSLVVAGCGGSNGGGDSSAVFGLNDATLKGGKASLKIIPAAPSVQTSGVLPMVITVTTDFGTPAADGLKLLITSRLGGKFSAPDYGEITLQKGGFAQTNFTAGTVAGVENIVAVANGISGSTTIQITATPQTFPQLRLVPSTDQVKPGESIPVVVFVNSTSGLPLNTNVKLYSRQGASFVSSDGTADNGVFTTTYTASTTPGIDSLTAVAGGVFATATIAVFP